MCMVDDCEPCEIWEPKMMKARKIHKCDICGRDIRIGEIYEKLSAMHDGTWWHEKKCEHCLSGAAWMDKHCGGYLIEGLLEELEEHWVDGYREDGLGRILVGIRRGWERFRGGLMKPIKIGQGGRAAF